MTTEEPAKRYKQGSLTILWKPRRCIHSGVCVKMLPDVYDPKARPWITPENASEEALINQIDRCPSGALSYEQNSEGVLSEKAREETRIEVVAKGPLLVHGSLAVQMPDGSSEQKKRTTAFCRCGASGNKPYCDGTHNHTDFEG